MEYGLDPAINMQPLPNVVGDLSKGITQGVSIADMMQQGQQRRVQTQGMQQEQANAAGARDAFKQSIDPATGKIDPDKLYAALGQFSPQLANEAQQSHGLIQYHNAAMDAKNTEIQTMQQNANTKSQLADDKIAFYQSKADAAEKAHADMRMSNLSNGLLGVTDPKAYAAMYPNLIKSGYDPKELADPNKPEDFAGWKAALNAAHPPFAAQKVADTESNTATKNALAQERINKMGLTVGTKESQQQDKLEQQARQNIVSVRGDKALANTEAQRDAAISAYNTITRAEKSGQPMNPIDYIDVLGQIYKARTGSAPTETILKEARQATMSGNLNKAFTFMTGQQAPATTSNIQSSLKSMVMQMGKQADDLHSGYMQTHLDMPTGLEQSRADRLRGLARGLTFRDAVSQTDPTSTTGVEQKLIESARSGNEKAQNYLKQKNIKW